MCGRMAASCRGPALSSLNPTAAAVYLRSQPAGPSCRTYDRVDYARGNAPFAPRSRKRRSHRLARSLALCLPVHAISHADADAALANSFDGDTGGGLETTYGDWAVTLEDGSNAGASTHVVDDDGASNIASSDGNDVQIDTETNNNDTGHNDLLRLATQSGSTSIQRVRVSKRADPLYQLGLSHLQQKKLRNEEEEDVAAAKVASKDAVQTRRFRLIAQRLALAAFIIGLFMIAAGPSKALASSWLHKLREGSEPSPALPSPSPSDIPAYRLRLFGRDWMLADSTPGWVYFALLMAAGCGLFVSEEALNVWVGGSLGRSIASVAQDGSLSSMTSAALAHAPRLLGVISWVYWGVTISDMVPFYAGRIAASRGEQLANKASGPNVEVVEIGWSLQLAMFISQAVLMSSKNKAMGERVLATVRRYGDRVGFVERFSLGIRNPVGFLAGLSGVPPAKYFLGVCLGACFTLPAQLAVGFALRQRPVAALAGVAAFVGAWSIMPYATAAIAAALYYLKQAGSGSGSADPSSGVVASG
eukprot:jgi/Chlat1/2488/Chrsp175S02358